MQLIQNKNKKSDVCYSSQSAYRSRSLWPVLSHVTLKSLNRSSAWETVSACCTPVISALKWSSSWQIRCSASPTLNYPNDVARVRFRTCKYDSVRGKAGVVFFVCAKRYTTRRRCAADTAAERSCAREWPGVPHDKRSSLYKFRCFARYLPSPNNTARQKSVVLHFDFNEPLQWWWPCIEQIFVVLFLSVFHV